LGHRSGIRALVRGADCPPVHADLNLYNNGFAAGIVASVLVQV
jgi:hypothetical protein